MRRHADTYETTLLDFRDYLKLERSMSPNTIAGYASDVQKYFDVLRERGIAPADATIDDITSFLDRLVTPA
jgi:integrase/recombinase XerD